MTTPGESFANHESIPISVDVPAQPTVVIGGGVIGAASAYYLAKAGVPVVLIDRGSFAKGSSHGNCGLISPSHILPLTRPGAVSRMLRVMWRRHSAFRIHMRWDPALWKWLWQFSKRCNEVDMLRAGFARQALLNSSKSLYDELVSANILDDCEWESEGLLLVYRTHQGLRHYEATDRLLREEYGLGAQLLDRNQLLEKEPALKSTAAGGWFYEGDAHLRPDKLMAAWKRRLVEMGVVIRENCEFIEFEIDAHGAVAIQTSSGRLQVEQVLMATGAWTPLLGSQLKVPIPIQPGKGYSVTMERPQVCPKIPLLFEEHKVAVTPMQTGYRIGSTMEFAGFNRSIRPERIQLLLEGARTYLQEPYVKPFTEVWYGWRPMSSDGLPMIGRVPGFENVYLAAGHSMLGISMATGTGKLAAEIMTGQTPHLDPEPFQLNRS